MLAEKKKKKKEASHSSSHLHRKPCVCAKIPISSWRQIEADSKRKATTNWENNRKLQTHTKCFWNLLEKTAGIGDDGDGESEKGANASPFCFSMLRRHKSLRWEWPYVFFPLCYVISRGKNRNELCEAAGMFWAWSHVSWGDLVCFSKLRNACSVECVSHRVPVLLCVQLGVCFMRAVTCFVRFVQLARGRTRVPLLFIWRRWSWLHGKGVTPTAAHREVNHSWWNRCFHRQDLWTETLQPEVFIAFYFIRDLWHKALHLKPRLRIKSITATHRRARVRRGTLARGCYPSPVSTDCSDVQIHSKTQRENESQLSYNNSYFK